MWKFTEIADWWDGQKNESQGIIDKWVEDSHYSQSAMIVGAGASAVMTFGQGFVDILRLGDGVKEGTLGGVGKDALRVVAIFPVGKAAEALQAVKGAIRVRLIADIPAQAATGGCFWVASAKALAQLGHKFEGRLFASVDDIAAALGLKMGHLPAIADLKVGVSFLTQLGVKVSPWKNISSVKELEQLVPRDGSVVMIGVNLIREGKTAGAHAIYAYRGPFGEILYIDRTVGAGRLRAYRSLESLAKEFGGEMFAPREAVVLYNMYVRAVGHEAARLVIQVLGFVASEENNS
ncbi:hypothetical protein AB4Y96_08745 [Phyllobacterium sp. TAF24]|uniref:hypothetical protein n=1 Tax=unclassified Phyllobacterium TaxID=2638441 RepID=UPI00088259A2|nr:hypothetical protein [Phyllobacterium sp. OV277]SDN83984.1 hypothetical protein SAMN05443582_101276 [Phyllobacterium sp. OV277]